MNHDKTVASVQQTGMRMPTIDNSTKHTYLKGLGIIIVGVINTQHATADSFSYYGQYTEPSAATLTSNAPNYPYVGAEPASKSVINIVPVKTSSTPDMSGHDITTPALKPQVIETTLASQTNTSGENTAVQPAKIAQPSAPSAATSPTQITPASATTPQWILKKGESLKDQVVGWGNKAGWVVIWTLPEDWLVPADTAFSGDFKSQIINVLTTLHDKGVNLDVSINDGNNVIVIDGTGQGGVESNDATTSKDSLTSED